MEPGRDTPDAWKHDPQRPLNLTCGGLLAVAVVVVVTLLHKRVALAGNNAVEHAAIELRAVVQDHIADGGLAPLPDECEIALADARLHARAGGDHEPRRASELRRRQDVPGRTEHEDG